MYQTKIEAKTIRQWTGLDFEEIIWWHLKTVKQKNWRNSLSFWLRFQNIVALVEVSNKFHCCKLDPNSPTSCLRNWSFFYHFRTWRPKIRKECYFFLLQLVNKLKLGRKRGITRKQMSWLIKHKTVDWTWNRSISSEDWTPKELKIQF